MRILLPFHGQQKVNCFRSWVARHGLCSQPQLMWRRGWGWHGGGPCHHAWGLPSGQLPWPTALATSLGCLAPQWSIKLFVEAPIELADSWASCALSLFIRTYQKVLRPCPFMRTIISSSCPVRVILSFIFISTTTI
jgi:hypothetical protein